MPFRRGAFRPGDIVKSRKGLFVEIDNTDAEGRLILADALTRAGEDEAGTDRRFRDPYRRGARRARARPAGDSSPMTTSSPPIGGAAREVDDPFWRMPLWEPYDEMLKSDVADIANAADSRWPAASTAALFLKRFVPDEIAWAHLDTYAWRDTGQTGRPKGGEALGLRAIFALLQRRYLQSEHALAKTDGFSVTVACNISRPYLFKRHATRHGTE